ncbi:MAG: hypothetical protein AB7U73_01210 [Pirellulales bacterium]
MSWSFNAIGKPELIAQALEQESAKLSGQCKLEFDDALPHLTSLLRQNFAQHGSGYHEPLIEFSASGSGSAKSVPDGDTVKTEQMQRSCSVTIKPLYGRLLIDPSPPDATK